MKNQHNTSRCRRHVSQINANQCIDFFPNWPRNREKINALTIEVRTLEEHMKAVHVMKFECVECREKFNFKEKLDEHVREVHVHKEKEEANEDEN